MTNARQLRDALRALIVAHGSFDEAERPCGTPLPMPYAHALLMLRDDDGLTVTELASGLNIDRSNVSRLTMKMVADGILVRRSHPDDGRATALFLTESGRELADTIDTASAHHFETLLERIEDGPEVVRALEKLTSAMEDR